MTTSAWRKFSKARRGCSLLLLPPLRSTPRPSHHRCRPLPVDPPPPDSSNNNSAHCSSPARRTTTAVIVAATGAVATTTVVAAPATLRIKVPTHLGLPSSTPGPALFRCGRVLRVSDSRHRDSPRPWWPSALLRRSNSAGWACICTTLGATAYPPWAHAADGLATARTSMEPVDWVLGPVVPHQLVQHHDAEPACHHGLDCRLGRFQPHHA
jgi:hypothetical protein